MGQKLFQVACAGQELTVYDDCVSFAPKGAFGAMTKGLAGERKIFYGDISSIQFKKSSALLSGFIEFYFAGHNTQKQGGGLFAGTTNDNRFTFYNRYLPEIEKIRDYIQGKIIECNTPQVVQAVATSDADELLKFKQLLDAGVITQDEFNTKKKQILGLF
jgi:hypothetical protein